MTRDYVIAVASLIKIGVTNSPGCFARLLRQAGYPVQDRIPESELTSALTSLHATDVDLFYDVMRRCQWNYGILNWTNDSKTIDKIISAVGKHTKQKVDKTNWWITTLDYLQKQK